MVDPSSSITTWFCHLLAVLIEQVALGSLSKGTARTWQFGSGSNVLRPEPVVRGTHCRFVRAEIWVNATSRLGCVSLESVLLLPAQVLVRRLEKAAPVLHGQLRE